ncbi:Villin-4, partial [Dichanthelium oligosanthes]
LQNKVKLPCIHVYKYAILMISLLHSSIYFWCNFDDGFVYWLQVWRVDGNDKALLSTPEQSKFYTGDCYIFQYTYTGDDKEECFIGTWFGKKSVEVERASAMSLASKMVQAAKYQAVQARLYEGREPIQFFVIFQSLQVFKGGLSSGYKNFIAENGIADDTYSEGGIALFRIQGSGSENMQALQVDAVASSLNSSYCYILHNGNTVFTWTGNLTTSLDHDLVERQLDVIKVKEIHHFTQDDLMTEDVFVLDCHSDVFVWVGQEVDAKVKSQTIDIGEKFLVLDFLMEKLSQETPIFTVYEGSEPQFFTRFFNWDSAKSLMHGSSYQRKLAVLKGRAPPSLNKPKRRTPAFTGRSSGQDKSQRSRSMSTSPDRPRVRGRSPAFNVLTSAFESPSNTRNLSTPPPAVRKLFPKSGDQSKVSPKKSAISSLTSSFEGPMKSTIPKSVKGTENTTVWLPILPEHGDQIFSTLPLLSLIFLQNEASHEPEKAIQEEGATCDGDVGENETEDDEGRTIYPYERLTTTAEDPVPDIDVTKRESYLSSAEFREKLGMTRAAFYKLPKWKQNKLKSGVQLF